MGDGSALLWIGCAFSVGGVAVLRLAWSRPRRVPGWNALAWAMLAGGVVCGWQMGGAWGLSIVALAATGAAMIALAIAGAGAPRGRAAPSNRRAAMLPQPGEPRRIGRRVATFLIVIVGGLLASIALGLGMRGAGMAFGWGAANANVAALYMVPLAWAVLATALLMQPRRRSQMVTLLACGLVAAPLVLVGSGS